MNTMKRLSGLVLLVGLIGCHKHEEHGKGEKEVHPVGIRVAVAKKMSMRPEFEIIGTVLADPERVATLTAATPGLVDKLAASEGSKVEKDQLVVRLDERKARTDLERAEAALARLIAPARPDELAVAQGAIDKAEAARKMAKAKLERDTTLQKRDPVLVPEVQLLDDQRADEIAAADLSTAKAHLNLLKEGPNQEQRREAEVEVNAMKLQLKFCQVTAPFSGEIVEVLARVGTRADIGTPLARIIDTSEVLVQARIPGNRLGGVIASLSAQSSEPFAEIHSASFPSEKFVPKSAWLNRQTEGLTGDVPIKLRLVNSKELLRVGLTVTVEIHEPAVEGIAIPEAAISVNEEGHKVVTVIKDGKAVPTEVEVDSETEAEVRVDGWVRILKGIAEGDEVAIENGYALPKDTPVEILPPEEHKAHDEH